MMEIDLAQNAQAYLEGAMKCIDSIARQIRFAKSMRGDTTRQLLALTHCRAELREASDLIDTARLTLLAQAIPSLREDRYRQTDLSSPTATTATQSTPPEHGREPTAGQNGSVCYGPEGRLELTPTGHTSQQTPGAGFSEVSGKDDHWQRERETRQ